jgi:PAS domain S-box-containing protein
MPSPENIETLHEQRDWLLVTLSSIGDAVITTDCEGRVTFLNPVAECLTGWTQEAVGQPLGSVIGLINEESRQPVEIPTVQALQEGRTEKMASHSLLIAKDGTERPISDSAALIRNDKGEIAGVVVVFRDIAERRKTERALATSFAYADDIIATLREPFVVLNVDLRVKTANRSFYDSFHVTKEETENCLVYHLGNGQWDIPGLRTLLDRVLSRNESVHDFEVEHTFPILGRKTMLLNARPFPPDSKHPELILLAVEDVSALRERADELAEHDRRKNEFLAMLAHELRNPLAPIRNALQIIRLTGMDGHAVQMASEMMERQMGQMVRLVDDLLDVNRISRGKIELQKGRIELASSIRHAVEAVRSLYKDMNHELTVTLPPQPIYLNADPTRLAQVVGNLLNNACKFTDKGGQISLTAERDGEHAVIRVRDSGIGIAADQLPRIFDMFVQVDTSLERSVGGLGIGLTLVKNLVEMHNGTVVVDSAGVGQGSEFVVRLPIMVEPLKPPSPEPTDSEAKTATARRILVVDDNPDSATSLAMLMKITGNETHTAFDGLEAVEAAATFKPDVILLDIGLPKLNGYEACRRIRQQPWGKNIVMVALTGWGQEEDREKSRDAGFNGHIIKPVEFAALTKLLADLLPTPV